MALSDIANWHSLSDDVATAGQPTAAQFRELAESGFQVVINLALSSSPGALADEAGLVRALGLAHVHIPVDFSSPKRDDYTSFCSAMRAASGRRVLVHCARNFRASAFVYLWRVRERAEDPATARLDMEKIWLPDAVWTAFLESVMAASRH